MTTLNEQTVEQDLDLEELEEGVCHICGEPIDTATWRDVAKVKGQCFWVGAQVQYSEEDENYYLEPWQAAAETFLKEQGLLAEDETYEEADVKCMAFDLSDFTEDEKRQYDPEETGVGAFCLCCHASL